MTLSKRQKVLLASCAVLMAALVVDRVTSGSGGLGPDTAVASPAIEPHDEPALLPVPPAEIPETGQEGRLDCLADRLEDLAERHSLAGVAVADAFCPPPAWLAPNGPVSVVETAGMDRARDFAARHELKAVMLNHSAGARAIIGNRLLGVGQVLDGFKLVSVDKRSAVLVSGDARVTLRLRKVTSGE